MSTKLSRRSFIRAAATATGGMILSFHLPAVGKARPYEATAGAGAEINAWLTIAADDTITIRVAQAEMGEGVFTALPMIVAEELEVDWTRVRAEYASANRSLREGRVYQRMGTGGSGAVRRSREYLQQAGAEAREKLIKAAAERWLVDPAECYADYGKVWHKPTRRSLNYGAIAAAAAEISVANVEIKTPETFNLIGLPTPRLDVPAKVNGSAVFGMDVRVPGMVYAAVIHCPVLGGSLRNYKFNVIRNMPGVLQAVRLENGVAVVARTWWQAKQAADALPVDWIITEGRDANSSVMRREFLNELEAPGVIVREEGQAMQAMEESEKSIESDYFVPYLAHTCLEPLNCTVSVTADQVDVWGGFQNPEAVLSVAAEVTGQAPEKVFVHNCYLGGGFGRRSHTDYVREAVLIAQEVMLPVQMIWSREEDTRQGRYRPMAAIRFKAGFDMDRNLVAYTNHSVCHSIMAELRPDAVIDGIDKSSVEGLENMPYAVPNKLVTHSIKNTHVTSWFWRSVGSSQNAFAMECFVDEMAEAAGQDPMGYRMTLLKDRPDMQLVLRELAKKGFWGRAMPAGSAQGIAIHECFGTICAQLAEITISPQGDLTVDKIVSVVDCGNLVNPMTAEEQIESGVIYGLTAALYGKLTIEDGRVLEDNFDTHEFVRLADTPVMETHWLLSGGDKWGGIGEPGTPCVAPAVCNAIYRVTGRRIRSLPVSDYYLQRKRG
ncbi:MAG: xanthine dehydrogenase family protein molybdopterin-binding subunit [Pseudomonadales bacterium]|nr:xanthine dehydrogenase family protein molybdopterin-binding subunit [Pseudomonadales bacterium]